jgi:hypothetical protein
MEGVLIQLRVDARGLKEPMSEHVSHLLEADAASDHLSCRRMPERMRAQASDRDPGKLEMPLCDATDGAAAGNRAKRCTGTEKDDSLSAFGPAVLHVFRDSLAHVSGQGKLSFPCGFRGMDCNLSFAPIDV